MWLSRDQGNMLVQELFNGLSFIIKSMSESASWVKERTTEGKSLPQEAGSPVSSGGPSFLMITGEKLKGVLVLKNHVEVIKKFTFLYVMFQIHCFMALKLNASEPQSNRRHKQPWTRRKWAAVASQTGHLSISLL